jgi:hypothetical protein
LSGGGQQRAPDESAGNRVNDAQPRHIQEDLGNVVRDSSGSGRPDIDDNMGNR